jgi:uncharacterized protein
MSKTVIIKPTHNCNLNCEYCYVGEDAQKGRMNSKTLENSFEKTIKGFTDKSHNHIDSVEFLWHGGEPLTMGLDFFKVITELTNFYKKIGYNIKNSIQTNGTLLNEETIEYFTNKEHEFFIGLSLDGPKEIHDKTRHYNDKTGSFDEVWKNILILKKYKKKIGAISVINKLNIDFIPEIYEFFKENDLSLKANPLINSGNAVKNKQSLGITPVEYGKAMINLFNLWFYDPKPNLDMTIDNLDSIVRMKLTNQSFGCNYSKSCQNSFISIGPNGDIYPCGRFDEIPEFRYGNINEDSLEKALNNPKRFELLQRTSNIESCRNCEHKTICNSGCIHNAYVTRENIYDKDYYCLAYKMIFGKVFKSINDEIKKAQI